MKILSRRFELHYVVIAEVKGTFEECMQEIDRIKSELLENDLYTSNPVIYRVVNTEPARVTIELVFQLNKGFEPEEGTGFKYRDRLVYKDCLYTRYFVGEYSNLQVEKALRSVADSNNVNMQAPYYVNIPIPGGKVIDVYAPITGM